MIVNCTLESVVTRKITSYNTSLHCAIVVNSKELRDKLQRGGITHRNLLATCLTTPLRDKLREKLHRVTLAYTVQSSQTRKCCEISCKEGILHTVIYLLADILYSGQFIVADILSMSQVKVSLEKYLYLADTSL